MRDRPGVADREHVAARAAPDTEPVGRCGGRLEGPGGAVVVRDRAEVAHREHVAARAPPHTPEHDRQAVGVGPLGLSAPGAPIVVEDQARITDREHVAPRRAPHAQKVLSGARGLDGPVGTVVMEDPPGVAGGEHVAPRAAPHGEQIDSRGARLRRPADAVVVEQRATQSDGPDIGPRAAPHPGERHRGRTGLRRPAGGVVTENLAAVSHGEDARGRGAPDGRDAGAVADRVVQPPQHCVLLRRRGVDEHLEREPVDRGRHAPLPRSRSRHLRGREHLVVEEIRLGGLRERSRAVRIGDRHGPRSRRHRGARGKKHLHTAHRAAVGRPEGLGRQVLDGDIGLEGGGAAVVAHVGRAQGDVRPLATEHQVACDAARCAKAGRPAREDPRANVGLAADDTGARRRGRRGGPSAVGARRHPAEPREQYHLAPNHNAYPPRFAGPQVARLDRGLLAGVWLDGNVAELQCPRSSSQADPSLARVPQGTPRSAVVRKQVLRSRSCRRHPSLRGRPQADPSLARVRARSG